MIESSVKMIINGDEFSKWMNYEIESSILNLANSFSFRASNDEGEMAARINPCDEVKITVDDRTILTGYIDEVEYGIDPSSGSTVQVTGRDLMSFVVDCSADLKIYKNITVLDLAKSLTIGMISSWSSSEVLEKIKSVKVEPGNTIADTIQKWLEKQKLAMWIDSAGTGKIGRPNYDQNPRYNLYCYCPFNNPEKTKYNNILQGSYTKDVRERFAEYVVNGTRGNTKENKGNNSRSRGYYEDSEVPISRKLVLSDGKTRSLKEANTFAAKEAERRIFDSEKWTYTVRGHYGEKPGANGKKINNFIEIDTMIDVDDQMSATSKELYVARVNYRGDENGQTTELELRLPNFWMAD